MRALQSTDSIQSEFTLVDCLLQERVSVHQSSHREIQLLNNLKEFTKREWQINQLWFIVIGVFPFYRVNAHKREILHRPCVYFQKLTTQGCLPYKNIVSSGRRKCVQPGLDGRVSLLYRASHTIVWGYTNYDVKPHKLSREAIRPIAGIW